MTNHIKKHIKPLRLNSLPGTMRQDLKKERLRRGLSQLELGKQLGLPQMHISGIETGKIIPRYDTLLDLVRVLSYDLIMVPRSLVPAVQAMIRDQHSEIERPLYDFDADDEEEIPHDEV